MAQLSPSAATFSLQITSLGLLYIIPTHYGLSFSLSFAEFLRLFYCSCAYSLLSSFFEGRISDLYCLLYFGFFIPFWIFHKFPNQKFKSIYMSISGDFFKCKQNRLIYSKFWILLNCQTFFKINILIG